MESEEREINDSLGLSHNKCHYPTICTRDEECLNWCKCVLGDNGDAECVDQRSCTCYLVPPATP